MEALMEWLVSTPINGLVLNYAWSWPTLESLHFLALCMLMGSLLIMDLRLIGFNRIIPLQAVHSLMPVAIVAFAINLITGLGLPVRRPVHVLRELRVLGQDELDRARGPQLPRLLHEGRAEDHPSRSQRADAAARQNRRRSVARILVRRALVRPITAVLGNRRRLTPPSRGGARAARIVKPSTPARDASPAHWQFHAERLPTTYRGTAGRGPTPAARGLRCPGPAAGRAGA